MSKKAIVGTKVGMTQVWNEDNMIVPVTVISVPACRVVQVKTTESHGYNALQVTPGELSPNKAKKLNQPEAGHFSKAEVSPGDGLMELRLDDVSDYAVGQELTAEIFETGDIVDVTGISKGKGFTGVMARHNFKGQRATHGAHLVHRMPGSIGQCATPARVFKGMKMAGHHGHTKTTQQNLTVVSADPENNLMLIKGAVPGPKGGKLTISNAVKKVSA